MRGCLLRVNGRGIPAVKLGKDDAGGIRVIIPDSEFGDIPLTPAFILEVLDLQVSKELRDADPESGWMRVTYEELVALLRDLQTGA